MKRLVLETKSSPNFIGNWNIDDKKLCDQMPEGEQEEFKKKFRNELFINGIIIRPDSVRNVVRLNHHGKFSAQYSDTSIDPHYQDAYNKVFGLSPGAQAEQDQVIKDTKQSHDSKNKDQNKKEHCQGI